MAVSSMGDVTDHISSDCQELDDVQRLELLNTLGKFSSLFSSLLASKNAYPMQNAKDLLFEVGQANYITVLDLTRGYWQIPMAEEAKPYTAFVTHHGHYQFCVMPFGMKNAGSTFQKVMDQVLVKHRAYCRSYIDDVAVFSKTWEQHMKHLV
ncbi:retrovirus-related Pol polyprotein from transposon 17.6 [Trichonephila clavipes]|nr:retrovirus-related Pol polyprotein from transposon 17.6 [Trichonephila clavipes]